MSRSIPMSVLLAVLLVGCTSDGRVQTATPSAAVYPTQPAIYQYAFETPACKRAIMWIPPECRKVRGVVIAFQAVLDKFVCDDPQLRAAAAEQDLAIIHSRGFGNGYFDYSKPETIAALDGVLAKAAEVSGYDEIAKAPILPLGHSGHAISAWNMAYSRPDRTIAVIGLHAAAIEPPAWDRKASLEHVPVIAITGEWEMWTGKNADLALHIDWVRGGLLNMRATNPKLLQYELVQPGAGHFNYDQRLAAHVADFVRAACNLRLPSADAPPGTPLKAVEPSQGWLGDVTLTRPANHPLAPYDRYTGDRALAFWYPSEDLARRTEAYNQMNRGKKPQMLGFVQEGQTLPPSWNVGLKPIVEADGETVRVKAAFVDAWPKEQLGGGTPIGHAASGEITYQLIGGWVGGGVQTGPEAFGVDYHHWGVYNAPMLVASHPGDHAYGYTEMAATINYPNELKEGQEQTIDFPAIPDQPRSSSGVVLAATSSAGLPVRFGIRNGPARIEGGRLLFTAVPPRSTGPVPITIIAWQLGRPIDPQVKTAKPVERTLLYGGDAPGR